VCTHYSYYASEPSGTGPVRSGFPLRGSGLLMLSLATAYGEGVSCTLQDVVGDEIGASLVGLGG
jgi:hypothetical protein